MISNLDSESQLALHAKRVRTFNCQFIDCLKKCEFLQTTSNIDILYTFRKEFFTVIIDLRLLAQNKTPFGSNQLANFWQKCMSTIQALLSQTDGTIGTRRLRGTCWDQELSSTSSEKWRSAAANLRPRHARTCVATAVIW